MPKRRLRQYKTYDPEKEGYGNADQWRQAFNGALGQTTSIDQARSILGISSSTSQEEIKKIYRKLAFQFHPDKNPHDTDKFKKIGEAYRIVTGKSFSPIVSTPNRQTTPTQSTILPQLLNEIEEHEIERYITDDRYCAQEKFNGRRRLLKFANNKTSNINKKGVIVDDLSQFHNDCLQLNLGSEFILDGEEVGDIFHFFDILSLNDINLRNSSYRSRIHLCNQSTTHIKSIYTAYTTSEKRALFNQLKVNKEGIIFKLLSGIHHVGYSDEQVKYKFYAQASVIVTAHNEKNSVAIAVYDSSNLVPVGNVTMTGHTKPPVSSVIEVRYLYIIRGGSLYQPNFTGLRDDVNPEDCLMSKLKFKE